MHPQAAQDVAEDSAHQLVDRTAIGYHGINSQCCYLVATNKANLLRHVSVAMPNFCAVDWNIYAGYLVASR